MAFFAAIKRQFSIHSLVAICNCLDYLASIVKIVGHIVPPCLSERHISYIAIVEGYNSVFTRHTIETDKIFIGDNKTWLSPKCHGKWWSWHHLKCCIIWKCQKQQSSSVDAGKKLHLIGWRLIFFCLGIPTVQTLLLMLQYPRSLLSEFN